MRLEGWRTWRRLGRELGPYLKPEWVRFAAVLVLSLVGTAVGLLPPLLARYLIDHVLIGRQMEQLWPVLALGLGLSGLAMALGGLQRYWYTQATSRSLARLRVALFRHVLQVPLPQLVKQRTGDLVSRINSDVAELQRAFTDVGLQVVLATVQGVGAGLWLFGIQPELALISVLVCPLLLGVVQVARRNNLANARELRGLTGEANAFLTESVQGAAFIQAHDAVDTLGGRFAGWHKRLNRVVLRQVVWSGLMGAFPSLVMGLNGLAVLGYASHLIGQNQFTVGGLVAFIAYQWRFYGPLRGLVGLGLRWQQAQAALERVAEVQRWPAQQEWGTLPDWQGQGPLEIRLEQVTYGYDGVPVLEGVTGTLPLGSTTVLVGANGAGKTTLLAVLAKVLAPQSGRVRANGQDLGEVSGKSWRAHLAMVQQEGVFFHGSVWDNLRLTAPEADERAIREVLETVGLWETVQTWPEGLSTPIGDRGMRLSGGQRQRLSLARALLRDPDLLLLDEATSAVDGEDEAVLWQRVKRLREGRTTLFVTHRADLVPLADQVWRLEGGRLVTEVPVA